MPKLKINKDLPNEITFWYRIFYETKKWVYIQIFEDNFIKNNLSKCKIIINAEKREFCTKVLLNQNQRKGNILEIKLQGIQIITDMSYMFYECSSLISLQDISLWNINVTNMSSMFYRFEKLIFNKLIL